MSVRSIPKVLESETGRTTKVTLLTRYRENFSRYLSKRKIVLDPPYKTDVWNNVESAYTVFELPVPYEVADLIFDDWLDDLEDATEER
jgi:hypothetical protein